MQASLSPEKWPQVLKNGQRGLIVDQELSIVQNTGLHVYVIESPAKKVREAEGEQSQ